MKGGWGLTYANKIREAQQVLSAGSTMNSCLEKRVVEMRYKTDYHLKRFKNTQLLEG